MDLRQQVGNIDRYKTGVGNGGNGIEVLRSLLCSAGFLLGQWKPLKELKKGGNIAILAL